VEGAYVLQDELQRTREGSLARVTPVLLTKDEEVNLGRTLRSLLWAGRVVIVDSGSTDRTREIAASFPNVSWHERPFDSAGRQWSFALHHTNIETPFVLALDADMVVPDDLRQEIARLVASDEVDGGVIPFEYRIQGHRLRGSLLPAQLRLLRLRAAAATDGGHTQLLSVNGPVGRLRARLIHDDRKPLERWLAAQARYAAIEAECVTRGNRRTWKSAVRRRTPFLPVFVGAYAYLRAGGPLGGMAARRYALERAIFEALLRYRIYDKALSISVEPDRDL
jgi:glycosyltransferase involved in cell wall biosynthesis